MELEPPLLVGLEGVEPAGGNREQVGRGDLDLAGGGSLSGQQFSLLRIDHPGAAAVAKNLETVAGPDRFDRRGLRPHPLRQVGFEEPGRGARGGAPGGGRGGGGRGGEGVPGVSTGVGRQAGWGRSGYPRASRIWRVALRTSGGTPSRGRSWPPPTLSPWTDRVRTIRWSCIPWSWGVVKTALSRASFQERPREEKTRRTDSSGLATRSS